MSMASRKFEFMNPVLTALGLDLPHADPNEVPGQNFDFKPSDRLLIFTADRQRYSEVRYKETLQLSVSDHPLNIFQRLENNEQISLSNGAIRTLEKAGRIVPVKCDGRRLLPGSSLALSDDVRKQASKAMDYVDGFYAFCEAIGEQHPPKNLTRTYMREKAEARGEKNMSYEWLRKMVAKDAAGTHFDRLMNFARSPARGNEGARKGPLVYEALRIAAHFAWSRPKGTVATMRDHFQMLMDDEPRFAPARDEVVDANGIVTLAKSTFQEYYYGVDYYTRDLLRFGADKAANNHRLYVRLHRPNSVLDIVDVDHLTTDVIAYLDDNPLAFGRLDLVIFRDRKSGVVIGYAIGFNSPSYFTFLRGLEHALFEKDPDSLYDGVRWPWHGKMLRLGVDNAMHLTSNSLEETAQAFGFAIIEHRPASPVDKGALERALGTIQRDVFHALPGTTLEAPHLRELFGPDREIAVPVIALSEAEAVFQHYIANIYNKTAREGLGGDLLTEAGVPDDIWCRDINNAPPRPMLDRSMFARLSGARRRVTIQKDGIRCEGIHYFSPELLSISLHPNTRRAKPGRASSRFHMTINVNQIGQAWVHDPYRDVTIEVAAVGPDAEYCKDMTLDLHHMLQKFRRQKRRARERCPTLIEARQHFHAQIMDLIGQARKKHEPRRKLAQFIGGQRVAERRRQVVELARRREDSKLAPTGAAPAQAQSDVVCIPEFFDRTAVPEADAPAPAATSKPKTSAKAQADRARPTAPEKRSIEDIAARHPDWDD